jgi:hypothetical protein
MCTKISGIEGINVSVQVYAAGELQPRQYRHTHLPFPAE